MKIGHIIREKRKEAGLKQEQIAAYLGVSTPAVNKWEKEVSYPDITLLAPLARILKTDLNTLLCFHEDLTEQEIGLFQNEVYECIINSGFESGFCLAKSKIEEYPNSDKLIYQLVILLEGAIAICGISADERKQYEESLYSLYERVAESENSELRDNALYMLASKYIGNGKHDKAQEIIDHLPNYNALDKRILQAQLWTEKGQSKKALEIYEKMLLLSATNVWSYMISLIEIENKQQNTTHFTEIAVLCSEYANVIGLPAYYNLIPLLLDAASRQNVEDTLNMLEKVITCFNIKFNFTDSILFRDIPFKGEGDEIFSILPGILSELKTSPLFSFIRDNDKFKELIQNY